MLHVNAVSKRYGDKLALDQVDLQVAPGEIVGLLGPNGTGKTTLVSIVAGVRQADAGSVTVDGCEVRRDPRRARQAVGYAPQGLGVYPTATVRENLRFFGRLTGLRRRAADAYLVDTAERMGLGPLLDERVQVLSGGQKRRLHAAAALVHRPRLALLDEPTVGADVETRAMLLQVVRDLARDGTAVVYTTHYLHELEVLGASLAVIEAGRVLARGSQTELIARFGASAVEITVDGQAPPSLREHPMATVVADSETAATVRVATDDPPRSAVALLQVLQREGVEPRSIEIVRPGLEAAYLALTGRRTVEPGAASAEGPDPDGRAPDPAHPVPPDPGGSEHRDADPGSFAPHHLDSEVRDAAV